MTKKSHDSILETSFVVVDKRRYFCGGGDGIRTHVRLLSNGFQDRLVMTASIPLRMKTIQFSRPLPFRKHSRNARASQMPFIAPCFRYALRENDTPYRFRSLTRYDRFDTPPNEVVGGYYSILPAKKQGETAESLRGIAERVFSPGRCVFSDEKPEKV